MIDMDKLELAIVAVLLAVVVVGAAFMAGADYISPAVAQAQAGIAAPGAVMTASSIGGWLIRVLGALVGLLVLIALGVFGYDLLKKRSNRRWVSGPDARWKRLDQQPPQEHKPDLTELLLIQMLRQGGGLGYYTPRPPAGDDNSQPLEF